MQRTDVVINLGEGQAVAEDASAATKSSIEPNSRLALELPLPPAEAGGIGLPRPTPLDYAPVIDKPVVDKSSYRLPMFDAMRVVAALAVIWTHTPAPAAFWKPYADAARFGTAFFTVAALILAIRSLDRRPNQAFSDYAISRAKRLGIPLLLWSAIYAVFFKVLGIALSKNLKPDYGVGVILGGASTHLWFLPYILLACVTGFPILKYAHLNPKSKNWLVPLLVLAGLAFLFIGIPTAFKYDDPAKTITDAGLRDFLFYTSWSLPTFFWGLAIAIVYPKKLSDFASTVIAIGGVVLFIAAFTASLKGFSSPVIQALKGVAAAGIALSHWSPRFVKVMAKYGTLSFGVYLVHMLFVTLFREVGGIYFTTGKLWFYPAVTILSFFSAYALSIICNKSRFGKVLFP